MRSVLLYILLLAVLFTDFTVCNWSIIMFPKHISFSSLPSPSNENIVINNNPLNAMIYSIGHSYWLLQSSSYISKLYPVSPMGVQECCQDASLGSSFNANYCKSKTMGVVSGLWFVDYSAKLCVSLGEKQVFCDDCFWCCIVCVFYWQYIFSFFYCSGTCS